MIRLLVIDDDYFDIMAFKRFFKNIDTIELETVQSISDAIDKKYIRCIYFQKQTINMRSSNPAISVICLERSFNSRFWAVTWSNWLMKSGY